MASRASRAAFVFVSLAISSSSSSAAEGWSEPSSRLEVMSSRRCLRERTHSRASLVRSAIEPLSAASELSIS